MNINMKGLVPHNWQAPLTAEKKKKPALRDMVHTAHI